MHVRLTFSRIQWTRLFIFLLDRNVYKIMKYVERLNRYNELVRVKFQKKIILIRVIMKNEDGEGEEMNFYEF